MELAALLQFCFRCQAKVNYNKAQHYSPRSMNSKSNFNSTGNRYLLNFLWTGRIGTWKGIYWINSVQSFLDYMGA